MRLTLLSPRLYELPSFHYELFFQRGVFAQNMAIELYLSRLDTIGQKQKLPAVVSLPSPQLHVFFFFLKFLEKAETPKLPDYMQLLLPQLWRILCLVRPLPLLQYLEMHASCLQDFLKII